MVIKKLISLVQRIIYGYEADVLTFSQAGEDLLIRNFFYPKIVAREKGVFIDIGAFHPYKHSNTYYLYRLGWRGINIDPRPNSMKIFQKVRPEDKNIEVAISDKRELLNYYFLGENSTMNSFSLEYIESIGQKSNVKQVIPINTIPLSEVIDQNFPKGTVIDFMNIDVEGLDINVLRSNNWSKYRPTLIAIEISANSLEAILNTETATFLIENEYEFYSRIPLSAQYVNTVFFVDSRK
ncbi:MAG TPA: FkbM family methyltransferase [Bacteroidia bacterium]|nr:FkbM family methyltransferase [Bacteroidia bacterium]